MRDCISVRRSLNWTNVGLKFFRREIRPGHRISLNWTNVGLKCGSRSAVWSPERSFELD